MKSILLQFQIAHINSSVNGIIYGLSNPSFRAAYKYLLKRYCCRCLYDKENLYLSHTNNSSVRESEQRQTSVIKRAQTGTEPPKTSSKMRAEEEEKVIAPATSVQTIVSTNTQVRLEGLKACLSSFDLS